MDSVQRSQTQEVIVQLTPQDTQHIIRYLGYLEPQTGDSVREHLTKIELDNIRRLRHYLQTVYEVNGYIGR